MSEGMNSPADQKKTIASLEKKIEELEHKIQCLSGENNKEFTNRSIREPFHATIECIGDFDLIEADGIDLSKGGICFQIDSPLIFDMRYTNENKKFEYKAKLVWIRQLEEDKQRLGFKFVEAQDFVKRV